MNYNFIVILKQCNYLRCVLKKSKQKMANTLFFQKFHNASSDVDLTSIVS